MRYLLKSGCLNPRKEVAKYFEPAKARIWATNTRNALLICNMM